MPSHRNSRTQEDIKRHLTDIIRSVKDPRVTGGLLSIVKVELASDLSHCKVYISSMEGMDVTKNAVKGLHSASGFIKRELGGRMQLRRLPELHFIPDDGIAHSADINRILRDLERP